MKFAVVEYNSKSGGIWRHTAERPNYLADPKREIDPTSFGCYVSALKGEHIPLKGLILGPVNKVPKPVRFGRKLWKRLIGSWPNYDIQYLLQFDMLLVVHQMSDAHEMVALARRIKSLSPERKHPVLIGVPTQPYGILKEAVASDPEAQKDLVAFMDACDVFVSVVQTTTDWYASLTTTPVRYLPQPYPVEFASHYFQPREQKKKTILVAGVTQRPHIAQGQIVARELQKEFPEYTITVPKVAEYDYDFTELAGANYTVLPFEQWQEHLKTLASSTLVINTDYTQTRGRVQTDCAAVGTPSLGGNSDGTLDLFPELVSSPTTATDSIIALGRKLLTDSMFYEKTVTHARHTLQKYDYPTSAARLLALLQH